MRCFLSRYPFSPISFSLIVYFPIVLQGTDVAREAAHIVLLDDSLSTLIEAILEGRGIFHSIRSFVRFQLSTSIAALSIVALANLLQLPSPLNAMQILWVNIIMDGPPAQSLGAEPSDQDQGSKPPRRRKEKVLSRSLFSRVFTSGMFILLGTFLVFLQALTLEQIEHNPDSELSKSFPFFSSATSSPLAFLSDCLRLFRPSHLSYLARSFGSEPSTRVATLTFSAFVFLDMTNALASRTIEKPLTSIGRSFATWCANGVPPPPVGWFSNKPFLFATSASILGQLLVVYFPPLQTVFQTEALFLGDWMFILLLCFVMFCIDECVKAYTWANTQKRTQREGFGPIAMYSDLGASDASNRTREGYERVAEGESYPSMRYASSHFPRSLFSFPRILYIKMRTILDSWLGLSTPLANYSSVLPTTHVQSTHPMISTTSPSSYVTSSSTPASRLQQSPPSRALKPSASSSTYAVGTATTTAHSPRVSSPLVSASMTQRSTPQALASPRMVDVSHATTQPTRAQSHHRPPLPRINVPGDSTEVSSTGLRDSPAYIRGAYSSSTRNGDTEKRQSSHSRLKIYSV